MPEIKCKYDQVVEWGDLKPHPKNYNKHPTAQIELLSKIIENTGWRRPVRVSKLSGYITAGHGAVLAASLKGWSVPVDFQDYEDEEQELQDLVADNKIAELADTDENALKSILDEIGDVSLAGIIDESLVDDGEHLGEDSPVEASEELVRGGEVWILGNHKVIIGSSTERKTYEALLGEERIDCIWTDPPYNVAYEGSDGKTIQNDDMSNDEFYDFLHDAFKNASEFTKPGSGIYIAHASSESVNFITSAVAAGFLIKQTLVWVKERFVLGRQDHHWQHEPILYGWKKGDAHRWYGGRKLSTLIKDEDTVDQMGEEELREIVRGICTDVIRHENPKRNDIHPTMKPVDLVKSMIENSSKRGDLVMDMFLGSGSTLMACEMSGRHFRGVELDLKYGTALIRRWENFTGKKAFEQNTKKELSE